MAIRNSWGMIAKLDDSVKILFLLGKKDEEKPNIKRLVENERFLFHDIIVLDIAESYHSLTNKSIAVLQWATSHCFRAKYLLKIDDDMFLNIKVLLKYLKLENPENSITGCADTNKIPVRNPSKKWYVSQHKYNKEKFPPYVSGTAYVICGEIIPKLLKASQTVPFLDIEDVFITGLCREFIKAKVIKHKGFTCRYREPGPCGLNYIDAVTGHHFDPSEMVRMWKELNQRQSCRLVDSEGLSGCARRLKKWILRTLEIKIKI
ncbi:beta-1,3-galactosyltransferase 1-like [Saccostrea echinata]|uniref:beta-1,3-galactosyltransferase 1-like n=1 Tax=Saccostrea echinata TaxID=191078 RepID=UPI002A83E5C4|nr:beta-1,3-galactosyltransferase 1-like [Saccostrea echinata]